MYDTPEFQALRAEYLTGAQERSAHLQEAVTQFRQGADVDLKQVRQEVHKIRGSGGFYGFRALSEAAARAEDTLIMVIDGELDRDDQQIASLVEKVVQEVAAAVAGSAK